MQNLVAILLATAVALLPLQSRTIGDCCCAPAQPLAQADASSSDAQGQVNDAPRSCCALMAARSGTDQGQPGEDRPAPGRAPCDDGTCPSPCCFAKVVASTERTQATKPALPKVTEPLVARAIGPGSPHLNQLRRPPRA